MQYSHSHRRRLCGERRQISSGLCNITLNNSFMQDVYTGNVSRHQYLEVLYPRQATDAILYASLVAVFYAAIILIVVGSNCHRFRKHPRPERHHKRQFKHLLALADEKLHVVHIMLKRHKAPAPTEPGVAVV